MEHRRFGRTGLQVPALTFGGGWVGGVLIYHDETTAHAALNMALEAGIDWIDTAAMYGNGVSETVIGGWLAARGTTKRPRLSTKFRLDAEATDFKDQMLRSVEASLGRLGLDQVELIYLHNPVCDGESGDGLLSAKDTMKARDAMETLREQGLCEHLGLTALGDPRALHQVVGSGRFDAAQVYYNMLNPTAWASRKPWNSTDFDGLLRVCSEHDMGVMGIRIFAGGHLAAAKRHGREIPVTLHADDAAEEARAREIWSALEKSDGTHAQAAIRFGLACPGLSTIVVGLGELDHLRLAIEAESMGPLSSSRLDALDTVLGGSAFIG